MKDFLQQFSNEQELIKVVKAIATQLDNKQELQEISGRTGVPAEVIQKLMQMFTKHGVETTIKILVKKYRLLKEQAEKQKKEESKEEKKKSKKKKEKSEKKQGRPKKTIDEKLEDAAEDSVLKSLNKYIRSIALNKLKEIIENGLLLEQYEEQIKREREQQFLKAYINEKARREILNEMLLYYLAGFIDRKTLAQAVLSIALDELFEPKLIIVQNNGGGPNGGEKTPDRLENN